MGEEHARGAEPGDALAATSSADANPTDRADGETVITQQLIAKCATRAETLGLGKVLVPIICALALWTLRLLEVSLLAAREGARRQSSAELITCLQLMATWGGALLLSTVDLGDPASNALASDLSASLMWLGSVWWILKMGLRTLAEIKLPGRLDLERTAVCQNNQFVLHRNNEFMFLMLGETVLQIIVAISPGDVAKAGEDPFFNDAALTAAGGFVVAVCMMFSFRRMVAGQLENYERTNAGLQAQAKEAADFAAMIARTQGAAGERINREMGRGGAVSPNGTPMPNRPPPTSPSPRTSPSPGSPESPEGASAASKTSTTFAPAAAAGPTVAGGAGGGAAVPAQLVSSDGSNLSGNLMQSSERKPPTRGNSGAHWLDNVHCRYYQSSLQFNPD